jgi:hypothetical protein
MSLSHRLQNNNGKIAGDSEQYEALIRQLKLLSKAQTTLFKVQINIKINFHEVL